jgi:hypothetical protein
MIRPPAPSRRHGIDRRQFLGVGAATGALAVTLGAHGLEVSAAEGAPHDPGSGTSAADGPAPDSYLVALLPGRHRLTGNFAAFTACDFDGATLCYTYDGTPAAQRGTVYAGPSGWLHAPLHLPAGATIDQIDVFGRRTTNGSQTWKLQAEAVFAIDIADPVTDLAVITTNTTTGPTHGVLAPASPYSLYDGWGYDLVLIGSSPQSQAAGFIVQYTPPRREFVPMTPARVFDSRFSRFGGLLVPGAPRTVEVRHAIDVLSGVQTTPNVVPLGAVAIAYNLTITETKVLSGTGGGYLALAPGTSTVVTASAINWSLPNTNLANGGVIQLGTGSAERKITIIPAVNATHAILDVTGYYV